MACISGMKKKNDRIQHQNRQAVVKQTTNRRQLSVSQLEDEACVETF